MCDDEGRLERIPQRELDEAAAYLIAFGIAAIILPTVPRRQGPHLFLSYDDVYFSTCRGADD
jgi:hypothetical protein